MDVLSRSICIMVVAECIMYVWSITTVHVKYVLNVSFPFQDVESYLALGCSQFAQVCRMLSMYGVSSAQSLMGVSFMFLLAALVYTLSLHCILAKQNEDRAKC